MTFSTTETLLAVGLLLNFAFILWLWLWDLRRPKWAHRIWFYFHNRETQRYFAAEDARRERLRHDMRYLAYEDAEARKRVTERAT